MRQKGGGFFQVAMTERGIISRFHIPDLDNTSINGDSSLNLN